MAMGNYTLAVLNAIRDSASTEYSTRIPSATRTNVTTIGNALATYTPLLNEFTTNLVGKIALTVFASKSMTNKLAPFKKGMVPFGADVEELFVNMTSAVAFDKDGATALARSKQEVLARYHRENRQDTYKVTLSDAQVKNAFRSLEGVQNLLTEIVKAMYNGSEYDEYVFMKELLAQYDANFFDYQVDPITDTATATKFIKAVRKAVADLGFVSTAYNKAGVKTLTAPEDLVLLINKDVLAVVDIDILSKAFNLGKTDFEPKIVVMDDFGSLANCYAMLVDKDFFMVYDTLHTVEEQRNAQGLFTNHFLHVWQILSLSQFKNAVKFERTP